MQLTAELSLYPLREAYLPVIDAFIATLREQGELKVITNAMSTQLTGDWQSVLAAVGEALRRSHEQFGRQVLVCKLIPGEFDLGG
jgi:uncharacterized protein YqgV (UPF0045/DUF77 family)